MVVVVAVWGGGGGWSWTWPSESMGAMSGRGGRYGGMVASAWSAGGGSQVGR
jgi:hypothetical protein